MVSTKPARSSARKSSHAAPRNRLATNGGEKCGLDSSKLIEISGLEPEQLAQNFVDSGTINEAESWVTGFDPAILENAQAQIQSQLEQFIADNLADPTVGDVIGGRKVIVQDFPEVPGNLPYRVVVDGARFAEVPEALQQKITLGFGLTHSGFPVSKVRLEHVWVEAGLDYEPSRGARHIEPDNWVPMDPSFKQYEFLEGLDPIAISGLDSEQLAQNLVDSGTVNEAESWVTGFDRSRWAARTGCSAGPRSGRAISA